eukprot:ctg_1106.g430
MRPPPDNAYPAGWSCLLHIIFAPRYPPGRLVRAYPLTLCSPLFSSPVSLTLTASSDHSVLALAVSRSPLIPRVPRIDRSIRRAAEPLRLYVLAPNIHTGLPDKLPFPTARTDHERGGSAQYNERDCSASAVVAGGARTGVAATGAGGAGRSDRRVLARGGRALAAHSGVERGRVTGGGGSAAGGAAGGQGIVPLE